MFHQWRIESQANSLVEREMRVAYGGRWIVAAINTVLEDHTLRRNVADILREDVWLLKFVNQGFEEKQAEVGTLATC